MKDKLLPFDRRMEILFMIISKRKVTRRELSMEFGVSDDVIDRDIVVLSRYIPLDIKREADMAALFLWMNIAVLKCILIKMKKMYL